jgi:MFS family permease
MDGKQGWLVVVAAFSATVVVFGITYSFGVLFDAMAAELNASRGATAIVFSVTIVLLFLCGAVTGPAADRYGPRPVLLTGALVMSVGLFLTATTRSIWVAYLTYGIGVGVGAACTYVPMLAAVAGWFDRYRAHALAVAVAGVGVGTMAVAPLAAHLVEQVGFRTTCLIFAVTTLVVVPLCALAVRRGEQVEQQPIALGRLLRSRGFARLYFASAALIIALLVPYVYLAPYAREHGLSTLQAATLVALMGGSSLVGRLGPLSLGARLGTFRLYRASFLLVGLSMLFWLTSDGRYERLALFAVLYGIGYGGWIASSPTVVAGLYGAAGLGRLLGVLYTSGAMGGLLGPPLAGLLIDLTHSYTVVMLLCSLFALGGWAILGALDRPPAVTEQTAAPGPASLQVLRPRVSLSLVTNEPGSRAQAPSPSGTRPDWAA